MAHATHPSPLARSLQPLIESFWIAFVILSFVVTAVWSFDLGEAQITRTITARELQAALLWLSQKVDVGWLTFAAFFVYADLVQTVGLSRARRWMILLVSCSWIVGALLHSVEFPFGKLHFTDRLGWLFGPVSLGWLFLWCIIIFGARDLVLIAMPRISHTQGAVLSGIVVALSAASLEPLGWKTRAWWLWMNRTPQAYLSGTVQSSLVWLIFGTLLVWWFRIPLVTNRRTPQFSRTLQVFIIFETMVLLSNAVRAIRS